MSQTSCAVSDFYDRFPYPGDVLIDGPPPGYNWRWCFEAAYASCSGTLFGSKHEQFTPKILDAGCGTGVSTDYLAHLNPGSEIFAIDISKNALKIASKRLSRSKAFDIAKVSFEKTSLYDLPHINYFDFVNSVGVLHHLTDPSSGLKKLASCMKPGGILHIFLYAEVGRREIRSVQRSLTSLGLVPNDQGVRLGRKMLSELPCCSQLRRNYEEKWSDECRADVNFADMYLHPQEVNYNLDTLFQLIENTDLIFVGFSNPETWNIARLLKGELLAIAKEMSLMKQWKLIEDLDLSISHFEFFLAKKPFPILDWVDDSSLLSASGKISPCLWGWPTKDLLDRDMAPLKLSSESFEFLNVLHSSRPGTPLSELPLGWSSSQIASTARDLLLRHVILISPG
ncbi:class I SAM-dependent methyltransferase [Prochlorococcus sp. MIT 1341]|uniref:class I SAM-dependent methyltransferase n=1 Tax=Prochlorococcus sp. MIT 1341 TaxID=3096221 RepID=UPI002A74996B|nr:class I SAM-dependent methyltransferase [Prochlorococcus sp. MIT 1341]